MVTMVQVSLFQKLLIHFQIRKVWDLINFYKMFDDVIIKVWINIIITLIIQCDYSFP